MAMIHSRGRLEPGKQWKERELSPERTKVWTEPKSKKSSERRVPVVYYLSRNGHLEHPHFMEVPLSSPDGLHLKDVVNRLNALRGKGMASLYSWSSKRGYKNGFVWQDLCEDDFIYPAHGNEYVLKGSEILSLPPSSSPRSQDSASSSSASSELRALEVRRSLDQYKIRPSDLIADAATQTDDKKHRRRRSAADQVPDANDDREEIEISPPPSSSSPETLESLITAGRRLIAVGSGEGADRTVGNCSSGRFRASAVLMQLVSCGSISVKENGDPSPSICRAVTRGGPDSEYFSGSLIESNKNAAIVSPHALKRSNSYNADRSSKLEDSAEKEIEAARAKCIPRRTKVTETATATICRSARGSKRISEGTN